MPLSQQERSFSTNGDVPAQRPTRELPIEATARAWNRCAREYRAFAASVTRPFAEDASRLVRIGAGSRVLDVATGTGEFSLAAAQRGGQVLATDFSESMLGMLEETLRQGRIRSIQAALMDGQDLSLDDDSFDVAGSLFGLVFFPDPEKGLQELYRVLKPGGQVVIGTWAVPARVELMRLVGEALMDSEVAPPEVDSSAPRWTDLSEPRRLRALAEASGFACVHIVEVSHVWTFSDVAPFARGVLRMTPSWKRFHQAMCRDARERFARALIRSFCQRQGSGPFAVTVQGMLMVGTKAN